MRHLPKTAGIDIAQMHDVMGAEHDPHNVDLAYTESDKQVGDIHTKGFTNPEKWRHARTICGVMAQEEVVDRIKNHARDFQKMTDDLERVRGKRKKTLCQKFGVNLTKVKHSRLTGRNHALTTTTLTT